MFCGRGVHAGIFSPPRYPMAPRSCGQRRSTGTSGVRSRAASLQSAGWTPRFLPAMQGQVSNSPVPHHMRRRIGKTNPRATCRQQPFRPNAHEAVTQARPILAERTRAISAPPSKRSRPPVWSNEPKPAGLNRDCPRARGNLAERAQAVPSVGADSGRANSIGAGWPIALHLTLRLRCVDHSRGNML
jgi:hypothetical protein